MAERVILYICNGKKCYKEGCENELCTHTTDLEYAKNYNSEPPKRVLKKKFNGGIVKNDIGIEREVYIEKEDKLNAGKDS